jgi:nitroreductase
LSTPSKLSPDELLTTTRAVRKRLDLERPVEKEIIEQCISIAQQAPTGGNRQGWHFVVVTDASLRRELGVLYRKGSEDYFSSPGSAGGRKTGDKKYDEIQSRIRESAIFLVENIEKVPVHVIPCIEGRTDKPSNMSVAEQASKWGSIFPAIWSFMLAARARGLGTTLTSFHLAHEKEAADLLGIPYDKVMQSALIPTAYTKGTDFRAAHRHEVSKMIHWDVW